MTTYWCMFFDTSGYLSQAENIDAEDDSDIIAKARAIQEQRAGSGYEIRDCKRLVDYVTHHAAAPHLP
jgi:hypothetical protein